jgi:hypothetical protein
MNEDLLLLALLSFTAGFIFKTILYTFRTASMVSKLVLRVGHSCIRMLGNCTYHAAYIETLGCKVLEENGLSEEAKIVRLQLHNSFDIWKEEAVASFVENYPEHYRWHITFEDWQGMLKELDHIYSRKKS